MFQHCRLYFTHDEMEIRFCVTKTFHQIMDERWESEIIEYGAINITGFRILDTNRRAVREFLEGWRKLDPAAWPGAGKELISVSLTGRVYVLPPPAPPNGR